MGRRRRRESKPLEQVASICAWTEVIDGQAIAGIAVLRLTDHGCIYGAGTMLLVPIDAVPPWTVRRRARNETVGKLLAEINSGAHYQPGRAHHRRYYYLPLIERVRDLNRA